MKKVIWTHPEENYYWKNGRPAVVICEIMEGPNSSGDFLLKIPGFSGHNGNNIQKGTYSGDCYWWVSPSNFKDYTPQKLTPNQKKIRRLLNEILQEKK